MYFISEIQYESDPAEGAARFARGLKKGMRDAIKLWKLNFAPKHFTRAGAQEYGYANRAKGYMIRKARKMKHQTPLVWTGTLRTMVLAQMPSPRVTDSGAAIGVSLSMNVPAYTKYYRTKSGSEGPRKDEELVRTSPAELDTMRSFIMKAIDNSLRRKIRKRVAVK